MTSVIIAAHNEAGIIADTLRALSAAAPGTDLEVIVVPNGCSDDTAEVARRAGARVVESPVAGKAAAVNLGDVQAGSFPRVYLDADIAVPAGGLTTLLAAFDAATPPLAVVPSRRVDTRGSDWVVRGYYAINSRLPAYRNGLFGRGLIVLSEAGRSRYVELPSMIADDLFLDAQFDDAEKYCSPSVTVIVHAPRRTADLVRRLVRVRRGNAAMRDAARNGVVGTPVRAADRTAWLREVVRHDPRLVPAAAVYVAVTLGVAGWARLARRGQGWGHDLSSRVGRQEVNV